MGAGLAAGCVRAPRKSRQARAKPSRRVGESSWLTEKRRTLMRRLSITVDLRPMRMVSKM